MSADWARAEVEAARSESRFEPEQTSTSFLLYMIWFLDRNEICPAAGITTTKI